MTNSPSTTALCQSLLRAVLKTPPSTSAMTSVTLYEPLVSAIGILTVVNDTENCIEMADPVTSEYEDEGDFSDDDFIPNRLDVVRSRFYQDFRNGDCDFVDHDPIEVSYPPDMHDDNSVYSTPNTRNGHKKPVVAKAKKTIKQPKPKVIKKNYVPVLRREMLTMVDVVDARKDSSSGPDMVHGNCIGKSDDRVRAMYDDIIALEQDVVLTMSTNASTSRVPTINERADLMDQLERVRREVSALEWRLGIMDTVTNDNRAHTELVKIRALRDMFFLELVNRRAIIDID
ncbi:hypothetical protein B484DRAFT_469809 [Ochromonadaceae sp. CCMP2298]|nr:hypothetical protein B484DRAFT_469809 [Ochromonadaceae sp. CCMP2298]